MSATPLLSIIKRGTFISFASSAEDMNNVFIKPDSNRKFAFSKFALLNLPNLRPEGYDYSNVMNLNNIEGHYINGLNDITPNNEKHKLDFSESFQNYVLNLESLLTSQKEYDRSLPRTCSERIFFKWLKENGCFKFIQDVENVSSLVSENEKRFSEDIYDQQYKKIVQYVGEIDMQGSNLASNENAYNEVYINIPTSNGSTPSILFKSISDKNYNEDTAIVNPLNSEFINGREQSSNPTSAGLTIEAIYDQDVQYNSLAYNTNGTDGDVWYEGKISNGSNAYYTDLEFGDATTDIITRSKKDGSEKMTYHRSRLDGISIDFDIDNYFDIEKYNAENKDKIVTFNQYNSLDNSGNFEFNALLLYYDVYDENKPEESVTNLFGVLFLNDMVSSGTMTSKFKEISKTRQDNFISQQGNGFGVKLNFKFDVSTNAVDRRVEISVNDYNTFSMSLFVDAINNLTLMNRDYETVLKINRKLMEEIENYNDIIDNSDISMLIKKLKEYTEGDYVQIEHENITTLLVKLQSQINDILKGKTSVSVETIIDLSPKDGIQASYKNNQLVIGNSRQEYNNVFVTNIEASKNTADYICNEIHLEEFSNLVVHKNNNTGKIAESNVVIRIDDKNNKWKLNQSMKIIFNDPINFNGKGILIYTDSENMFNYGNPYSKLIGIVDEVPNNNPVIEIICIDEEKYEFIVTCK